MTDLSHRFEAPVFAPERERMGRRWHVIQSKFVSLFFAFSITLLTNATQRRLLSLLQKIRSVKP
jgi:hypothetical protein